MIIDNKDLLNELLDFLLNSEDTAVEDMKSDYFSTTDDYSFTEWVYKLLFTALFNDKFRSALPGWKDVDLLNYLSMLQKSLLAAPEIKEGLQCEYDDLVEMIELDDSEPLEPLLDDDEDD